VSTFTVVRLLSRTGEEFFLVCSHSVINALFFFSLVALQLFWVEKSFLPICLIGWGFSERTLKPIWSIFLCAVL